MHQCQDVAADQGGWALRSEHPLAGRIDVENLPLAVMDDHGRRHQLHQLPVAGQTLLQTVTRDRVTPIILPGLLLHFAVVHPVADGIEQLARIDRLLQVGNRPFVQRGNGVALVGVGRNHNDRTGREMELDMPEYLQARLPPEHDIKQGDVDGIIEPIGRLFEILGLNDQITALLKHGPV